MTITFAPYFAELLDIRRRPALTLAPVKPHPLPDGTDAVHDEKRKAERRQQQMDVADYCVHDYRNAIQSAAKQSTPAASDPQAQLVRSGALSHK